MIWQQNYDPFNNIILSCLVASIPVIVITAKDLTPEDRHRLSGHVQAILQKGGYSRQELLREIRDLTRQSRGEERTTA